MTDEPREIFPIVDFGNPRSDARFKDYSPSVEQVVPDRSTQEQINRDLKEVDEAEEVMTPAPKAESAPESASLPISPLPTEPARSEIPVLPELPTATRPQVADKENGKDSDENEDESVAQTPTIPAPVTSLPDSSLAETKSGSVVPPVPVKPPTSGPIQS